MLDATSQESECVKGNSIWFVPWKNDEPKKNEESCPQVTILPGEVCYEYQEPQGRRMLSAETAAWTFARWPRLSRHSKFLQEFVRFLNWNK